MQLPSHTSLLVCICRESQGHRMVVAQFSKRPHSCNLSLLLSSFWCPPSVWTSFKYGPERNPRNTQENLKTNEIPTFKSQEEYERAHSFFRDFRDGCKIPSCSMTVSFFKDLSCQPPLPIHAEIGRGTNSKHGETTEGGIMAHPKEGSAQPTFLLFSCREADRSLSRWCYSKVI